MPLFLLIVSCASNNEDENKKFNSFLNTEWENTLKENPIFATYTGDKRYNTKISSNSIDRFNEIKISEEESLNKLKSINFDKLNEDNKLNYKLYLFDLQNSINLKNYPTYCYRLNQRGGIQSFYETGDRLVYSSEQDYLDWYMRLEQFSENIKNSIDNNKKCLNEGFTQPKIMTNGVIAQIDGILNVSIEDNPYYKVFSNIDNESLQNSAKELIINKIKQYYDK